MTDPEGSGEPRGGPPVNRGCPDQPGGAPVNRQEPGGAPVDIRVDRLAAGELEAAVGLLARAMRDNPMHLAAFGDDPRRRLRRLDRLFEVLIPALPSPPLVARDGDRLVGVLGRMPPGGCRAPALHLLPRLAIWLRRDLVRVLRWHSALVAHHPPERHWHLGPVAVEPDRQGQGIGTLLMQAFDAEVDATPALVYLDTDKPANVVFYERFGFRTVAEVEALGTVNWIMTRPAR